MIHADLHSSPDIDRAEVRLNPGGGEPFVVIYLGQYLSVHVKTAADARELAAAFTEAARLLNPGCDHDPGHDCQRCLPGGAA